MSTPTNSVSVPVVPGPGHLAAGADTVKQRGAVA
jgi:hypothetical protein